MATASARSRQPMPLIKAARLWRDDPDNDRNQRELCEAVDALESEETPALDDSAALIALLDATLDHHRAIAALASAVPGARRGYGALLKLDPAVVPNAEHVLRLWASARNFRLSDTVCQYEATAQYPHGSSIRAIAIEDDCDELVRMQWRAVERPAPVTATAVVEALRAPHWTDDHTSSLDATETREVVSTEVPRG